ncbi:MAG TPA: oligosaccharide flippase family protein, partial [Fervidobacterium sp.]|nr:oligosaccharide flippase family protein [Fervidobacterium sp.]
EVVGFYALANMLVVLPGSLISDSMGQAYIGEASKMVREKSRELRSLYVRTLKHLSMIAIPLIGIPALCAPFVVPIVFGEVWVEAGWYCWPLALATIMGFVVSPTSFLSLYGYNWWQLIWDINRTIWVVIGFYICYILGFSALIALLIYSGIRVLMNVILVILNIKAISNFLNGTSSGS